MDTFRRPPGIDVDESVDVCPICGLTYGAFRTGLTFAEVRNMYWVNDPDSTAWKYKRRNTVLGKWRQIKLEMWVEHLYMCADAARFEGQGDPIPF